MAELRWSADTRDGSSMTLFYTYARILRIDPTPGGPNVCRYLQWVRRDKHWSGTPQLRWAGTWRS